MPTPGLHYQQPTRLRLDREVSRQRTRVHRCEASSNPPCPPGQSRDERVRPGLCAARAKGILSSCVPRSAPHRIRGPHRAVKEKRPRTREVLPRLFEGFARLFREREDHTDDARAQALLQRWMAEAQDSGIAELNSSGHRRSSSSGMFMPYTARDSLRAG